MGANKVKWMRMVYNYFKKTYLLCLACIWILTLAHGITANPQHSATVNTTSTFIPVGVETVVFRLDVTNLTTTANMTLNTIRLDKIGADFFKCVDMVKDRTGALPIPINLPINSLYILTIKASHRSHINICTFIGVFCILQVLKGPTHN